jgi:hypothetical protein
LLADFIARHPGEQQEIVGLQVHGHLTVPSVDQSYPISDLPDRIWDN